MGRARLGQYPEVLAELAQAAQARGLALTDASVRRFETYLDTLLLWRSRLSLTGAATAQEIVRRHIVDSLSIASYLRTGFRVADIGSGAGFPAIPLAIVCPDATFALIESRRKRANFLREVIRNANLTNAEVLEQRAESLAARAAGAYDIVTSRALGPVAEFLGVSAGLLKTGGLAIAMKGPKGLSEAAHSGAPFAGPEVISYTLHGGVLRLLLVYRKQ